MQQFEKYYRRIAFRFWKLVVIGLFIMCGGCEKLVEVDAPINKVTGDKVFASEALTNSAILGIYSDMMIVSPTITSGGVALYGSVLSDENIYSGTDISITQFAQNEVNSKQSIVYNNLWYRAYQLLYTVNYCINGVTTSTALSAEKKNQYLGECKFLRGFLYFYLQQLYGEVPIVLSTSFETNSAPFRSSNQEIEKLILDDLTSSYKSFSSSDVPDDRLRPNKFAVASLLSRFYLYRKDWKLAEQYASVVIESGRFELLTDLKSVFLIGSKEAIWQLSPVNLGYNTTEGDNFIPRTATTTPLYQMRRTLIDSFEPLDKRKDAWISFRVKNADTTFFPYKYKVQRNFAGYTVKEGNIVFRFSEQYLVRAEARLNNNNLAGCRADLDLVRSRSGIDNIDENSDYNSLLNAVIIERQHELFCEWGHRWFDLKRQGKLTEALMPLKANYQVTDSILPIPNAERLLNPNLTQNNGYN